MNQRRPTRAPYWPDRSAHRRRRLARRWFWAAMLLVLVLPWFGYREVREWMGRLPQVSPGPRIAEAAAVPGRAEAPLLKALPTRSPPTQAVDEPAFPEAVAGEVEAIGREARAGDGDAAVARLEGLDAQVQRDARLSDRGSAVRREAARRDLSAMAGVRAAGWVDRVTLLLLASGRGQGQSLITDACRRLAAHGDVSGLAVRVQEVGAGSAGAGALFGECRQQRTVPTAAGTLGPFPGSPLARPADGDSLSAGAAATPEDPAAAAERRRREEESLRILSESTPELPAVPQARVDP